MGVLSVNRNFYFFGIFFTALQLFLNSFHSILYLKNGIKTRYLESFPIWFLVLNFVAIIGLLILLKYYYHKKYWITLVAAVIFGGASFFHAVVIYFMLTAQRLESAFIGSYNLVLLASMLYGISLIASYARKRYWLKIAGILLLILGMALTVTFIWGLNSQDFELRCTLDKIQIGITMVGGFLPLPFIMNFRKELKAMNSGKGKPTISKLLKVCAFAIIVLVGIPSINLTYDSMAGVLRNKTPSERAKRLAEPFEARIFVNDKGKSLPYRLMKPLNYDPTKRYPLAVCLHHGGGNGTENIIQIETSEFAQTLAEPENREKYPAFIFVPQSPPGSSFGGIPNYPQIDDLVFESITALEKEFAIDERRRYVMGVSLGGFGSWHFIGTRPEKFAAAMPICGGGNPEHAENMVDIPIWAFHGEQDWNVPVKLSREMIKGIRKAGGKPKYIEFEGIGHNIWGAVDETPGKLEWLFAQKR